LSKRRHRCKAHWIAVQVAKHTAVVLNRRTVDAAAGADGVNVEDKAGRRVVQEIPGAQVDPVGGPAQRAAARLVCLADRKQRSHNRSSIRLLSAGTPRSRRARGNHSRMSWADRAIEELRGGRETWIRPHGNSMRPKVLSGARVRVAPIEDPSSLARGEIVLVKVNGNVYLHLVSAADNARVQISNNRGRVNGWVARGAVYGRAVEIDNSCAG
jgi:hypothetical protein